MSSTTKPRNSRRKKRSQRPERLRIDQLNRSIFLDVESLMNGPPLIGGTLIDGIFEQFVLDDRLRPAAEAKNLATVRRV